MCHKTHGAAGAVNRPVVPHAPCKGKPEDKKEKTGAPWSRNKHGAMSHVCTNVTGLFDN